MRSNVVGRGACRVENGRENSLTVPVPVIFVGNGNENGENGWQNEFDITGYREQIILIENISISIRKISIIVGNTDTYNHLKHLARHGVAQVQQIRSSQA